MNYYLSVLIFFMMSFGVFAQKADSLSFMKVDTVLQDSLIVPDTISYSTIIDSLLLYAKSFEGVPYRSAGRSAKGFDCSGFTHFVFKKFGPILHFTPGGQALQGFEVHRDSLLPGDLVFFKGRSMSSYIGHVGIVSRVEGEKFWFIHASVYKGITEAPSTMSYYVPRYVKARRIEKEKFELKD